jgi:hypothetical protein
VPAWFVTVASDGAPPTMQLNSKQIEMPFYYKPPCSQKVKLDVEVTIFSLTPIRGIESPKSVWLTRADSDEFVKVPGKGVGKQKAGTAKSKGSGKGRSGAAVVLPKGSKHLFR